jgi:hypothetical protein
MPDPIRGVSTPNPVTATSTGATSSAQIRPKRECAARNGTGADLADVAQTEALLQTIVQAASNTPASTRPRCRAAAGDRVRRLPANPQSIAQKLVELENLLGTAGQVQ